MDLQPGETTHSMPINRSPSFFLLSIAQCTAASFLAQQATHSMCNFEQSYTAGSILQKLHDKITKWLTPCSVCPGSTASNDGANMVYDIKESLFA